MVGEGEGGGGGKEGGGKVDMASCSMPCHACINHAIVNKRFSFEFCATPIQLASFGLASALYLCGGARLKTVKQFEYTLKFNAALTVF